MSYIVKYQSNDGKPLLGGVLSSQSSRFGEYADAEAYLSNVIELNGQHCVGKIVESKLLAEIYRHCKDSPAQSKGCKCFKCRQILT